MGHKDYKTINLWLRDLRGKHYVEWIYSTDFLEKTKPGIYYLALNGIRLLKTTDDYPVKELRKRYREPSRSRTFIDRCVLLAGYCVTLGKQNTSASGKDNVHYSYVLEADYADPENEYHFLTEEDSVHPQLCFIKETNKKGEVTITSYLLEVFDAALPRYRVRKRLKDYVKYLEDEEWQSEAEDNEPPIVLFVCPTKADLIYCKRATKRLLEDVWDDEDIHMRFTTTEKLKEHGVTAKIWEEAKKPALSSLS